MRKIKLNGVRYEFPRKNNQHLLVIAGETTVSLWMGDTLTIYNENAGNEILIRYEIKNIKVFCDNMLIITRELYECQ